VPCQSPNIDRVTQRGWGLIIKLRSSGAMIIRLSKKWPLFARGLSVFFVFCLFFKSLKNSGFLPEKNYFGGTS
jgi:hypothetical protein